MRRTALRLALHTTAATFLVIAAMIAVVGTLLVRDADTTEAAQLTTAADRADDVEDPPAGMWIVMQTGRELAASPGLPAGFPLTAALDRVAASHAAEDTSVTVEGRDYRVRTQPRRGAPGWCSPRCSAGGWASAPSDHCRPRSRCNAGS